MFAKTALPILASSLLLFGCGTTNSSTPVAAVAASVVRTVQEVSITSGIPVTMADISIEGMSCEMMCGGSIKKALGALPGIASTEIKFFEGDEQDHAVVSYDESMVNDTQMIEAIQALHDGQYKVMAVKITKQVKGATTGASVEDPAKEEARVNTATCRPTPAVLLPSLFAILTRFLTR